MQYFWVVYASTCVPVGLHVRTNTSLHTADTRLLHVQAHGNVVCCSPLSRSCQLKRQAHRCFSQKTTWSGR